MKNLTRNLVTKIASGYLIGFAIIVLISSKTTVFTDSPRYFLKDDKNHLLNELWDHSGSYIQTTLFSVSRNGQGAFISNLAIWLITGLILLTYANRFIKTDKAAISIIVFISLLYTSNSIANWLVGVASESIGLSFLFLSLIPLLLKIFNLSKSSNFQTNFILISTVLLAASKPLWAALLIPLIAIFTIEKNNYKQIAIILIMVFFGSSFITLKSASRPYDETSLTYMGWYSLTRAYAYSMENRLGEVALGEIKDCKPVMDLLIGAQLAGTPSSLYYEYNSTSKLCPGLTENLNENPKNKPISLLLSDPGKSINLFIVSLSTMVKPVVYATENFTSNSLFTSFNFLFHSGSYALLAGILLSSYSNKKLFYRVLFISTYSIFGAFAIYIQDGIEWERHMLPMTMLMSTLVWLALVAILVKDNKLIFNKTD